MKEVIAIIRMNMMNVTKRALADAGVTSLTARKVMGRGKGQVEYLLNEAEPGSGAAPGRQLGPGPTLVPKRMVMVVAPDAMVPTVIDAIATVNHTGNPGDGKIFVCPVTMAIRVRTGEAGDTVLDEAPVVAE
jgi:nitrogen regulatory protein PII 2